VSGRGYHGAKLQGGNHQAQRSDSLIAGLREAGENRGMPTIRPETSPTGKRSRRRRVALLSLVCVIVLVGIAAYAFRTFTSTSTPVTLSRETTYIMGPLREDGSVDYLAATNERYGEGVTPDNNASVLIWQALGPRPCESAIRETYFEKLGMPIPRERGDYFASLEEFAKKVEPSGAAESVQQPDWEELVAQFHATGGDTPLSPNEARILKDALKGKSKSAALVELESALEQAVARPWTSDEFRSLAEWLHVNEESLDLVTRASRRPHLFDPLVAPPKEAYRYIGIQRTVALESRSLADALLARAMLRISTGQSGVAWQDLMAAHRLSRLVTQGPTLIDFVGGLDINRRVCTAERALFQHARVGRDELSLMRKDLEGLSPIEDIADKIDWSERLACLDSMAALAREMAVSNAAAGSRFPFHDFSPFRGVGIDWNQVSMEVNAWLDRSVAACRT
jgi:hypothetical protein